METAAESLRAMVRLMLALSGSRPEQVTRSAVGRFPTFWHTGHSSGPVQALLQGWWHSLNGKRKLYLPRRFEAMVLPGGHRGLSRALAFSVAGSFVWSYSYLVRFIWQTQFQGWRSFQVQPLSCVAQGCESWLPSGICEVLTLEILVAYSLNIKIVAILGKDLYHSGGKNSLDPSFFPAQIVH